MRWAEPRFTTPTAHRLDKIDGFVQERRNSIANALELRLFCTNPSRWYVFDVGHIKQNNITLDGNVMMSPKWNTFRMSDPLWEITSVDSPTWWIHPHNDVTKTFSALLALCEENPLVTDGSPSQRPVTGSFDVFFDLCLNKRLSKQSRRRWFETPSHSLWHHCNAKKAKPRPEPMLTYCQVDLSGPVFSGIRDVLLGPHLLTCININLSMDK